MKKYLEFRKYSHHTAGFCFSVLLLVTSIFCDAKQITKDESLKIARQFYLTKFSKETKLKSLTTLEFKLDYVSSESDNSLKSAQITTENDVAYYYIYNVGDNLGFVIVSGDDRTTPVLGYSNEGKFSAKDIPNHVIAFMDSYKNQIKALMQDPEKIVNHEKSTSIADTTAVAPLLKTKWGQYAPFWSKIPIEAPTGCVATAMAQVMNYFKWPLKGTSSYSYNYNGKTFSANFGNTTYDWANMLDMYYSDDDTTSINCKAVSILMYHCGVSLNMQYTPDASGASTSNVPFALKNFFGYDKNVRYITSDNYTPNQFKYQVMLEIKEGRPVIIAGHDDQMGHSYIADGYDSYNFIHLNWGWYGDYNGFYEMNPIDASTYWIPHGIVIGIQKPVNTSDLVLVYQGFNLTYNTSLSKTQPITTSIKISEENNKSFNGEVALAFYKNEMLYNIINSTSSTINSGSTESKSFNISIPDTLSVGTYRLVPLSKSPADAKWTEMKYKNPTLTTDTRTNENIEFVVTNKDLNIYQNSKTMDCTKGDFRTKFLYADWENVQRLVVSGDIDQFDLMYMAGAKSIKSIDISKAFIIGTKLNTSKLEYGGLPSDFYKFADNLSSKWKNFENKFWNGVKYIKGSSAWKRVEAFGAKHIYTYRGIYYIPEKGDNYYVECNLDNSKCRGIIYEANPTDNLISIVSSQGLMFKSFSNSFVEKISLPTQLDHIAPFAFSDCPNLKAITIPDSVALVGDSIFYNCQNLTEIKFSKGLTNIWSQGLNNLKNLEKVTLPSVLDSIKGNSFTDCKKLSSINMPETLKKIGKGAFSGCSGLTTITIPMSVDSIGTEAFLNCTGLTAIYAHRKMPVTLDASPNVFFNSNKSATTCILYVPEGSKSEYQKASQWKDFYNIVEMPNFTLSPSSANITANSGNYSDLAKVAITSKWTANSNQSWLKLTTESGSGNGQIAFTVTANPTIQPRMAIITVSAEGFASQAISITQAAGAVKLAVSSNEISLKSVADSSHTVDVISNTSWTASSDQTWLDIRPNSGILGDRIELYPENNTTTEQRTAIITITARGFEDQFVFVKQEAGAKILNINSGGLASKLSNTEKANITNLILSGTIDARDFRIMRDEMPLLSAIDLSNVSIVSYTGKAGPLSSDIIYPANTIPECAFSNESHDTSKVNLMKIIFPGNLTGIDNYAFLRCSGLKGELNLPSSITNIGRSAFNSCTGLSGVLNLPASLKTIGRCAFYNCPGFSGNLTIPSLVETIGDLSFSYCSGFDGSLTISNSVKTIMEEAFNECSGFKGELRIPSSVITIGDFAFSQCTGFNGSLKIGASVKSIGKAAFQLCSGFKGELIIPSSVDSIKDFAFNDCEGFTGQLTFPDSIKYIGNYAFYNCQGFTGLKLPNSLTAIHEHCFAYCSGLSGSLIIPSNVETIGDEAFDRCSGFNGTLELGTSLKNIGFAAFELTNFTGTLNIPSSADSIKPFAFAAADFLDKLIIPSSISYIGSYAFEMSGLKSIYVHAATPLDLTSTPDVFYFVDKNKCQLFVPKGSVPAYKTANQWKDFYNISEIEYTNLDNQDINNNLIVYSVNDKIFIQITGEIYPNAKISIYDLNGRIVNSNSLFTTLTELQLNKRGFFLVKITNGRQLQTSKISIN